MKGRKFCMGAAKGKNLANFRPEKEGSVGQLWSVLGKELQWGRLLYANQQINTEKRQGKKCVQTQKWCRMVEWQRGDTRKYTCSYCPERRRGHAEKEHFNRQILHQREGRWLECWLNYTCSPNKDTCWNKCAGNTAWQLKGQFTRKPPKCKCK